MKSFTTLVFAASAALTTAQFTSGPDGTFTCAIPNAAYCAGDSLVTNIIIRCTGTVGQAGNCDDNLAGEFPFGDEYSPCWQPSATSGEAACSKNCVVYGGSGNANGTFTLPASVCTPSAAQSSAMSSTPNSPTTGLASSSSASPASASASPSPSPSPSSSPSPPASPSSSPSPTRPSSSNTLSQPSTSSQSQTPESSPPTSSSPSTPPTSSQSPPPSAPTSASSTPSTLTSLSDTTSSTLSNSAKAGIGVGAAIGGLLLFGLVAFAFFRYGKWAAAAAKPGTTGDATWGKAELGTEKPRPGPAELGGNLRSELDATAWARDVDRPGGGLFEMAESAGQQMAELDAEARK